MSRTSTTRVFLPVTYAEVRTQIGHASVLLWRPTSVLGKTIRMFSPADRQYCHAGLACWRRGDIYDSATRLESIDTQYGCGGDIRLLSDDVQRWPGCIDVFEVVHPRFKRDRAGNRAAELLHMPYGYRTLARMAIRAAVPFLPPLPDERVDRDGWVGQMVCSQAVAWELRAGGVDPLLAPENAGVTTTAPWHLAVPSFARYQFTLYWTTAQVRNALNLSS